tara:strand:+ start:10443 stop:10652 length:210 start_codon:yes stop_codon:yes gene_type:complete
MTTTSYIDYNGERIPVSPEGIFHLIRKLEAMDLDFKDLYMEIRELEHILGRTNAELQDCLNNSNDILGS